MYLSWRRAFTFMFEDDAGKRALAWGGLAMLLVPPLGWIAALGYRKQVAFRLIGGHEPIFPEYLDVLVDNLRAGAMATGTIMTYFVPFLILYWWLGLTSWEAAALHAEWIALFVVAVLLFVPLCFPALVIAYPIYFSWMDFQPHEIVILGTLFAATTFFMPAVFVELTRYRSFGAAFRAHHTLKTPFRIPGPYLESWALSLVATGIAFATLFAAPWGIFWSYLAIIFAFNEMLARYGREAEEGGELASVHFPGEAEETT